MEHPIFLCIKFGVILLHCHACQRVWGRMDVEQALTHATIQHPDLVKVEDFVDG